MSAGMECTSQHVNAPVVTCRRVGRTFLTVSHAGMETVCEYQHSVSSSSRPNHALHQCLDRETCDTAYTERVSDLQAFNQGYHFPDQMKMPDFSSRAGKHSSIYGLSLRSTVDSRCFILIKNKPGSTVLSGYIA